MTISIPVTGNETPAQMNAIVQEMVNGDKFGQGFSLLSDGSSGANQMALNLSQMFANTKNLQSGNSNPFSDVQSGFFDNGFPTSSGGLPWSGGSGANVGGNNLSGDIAAGQTIRNAGANAGTSLSSWLLSNLGNASFITIGVLLALGALLISQRQTIVKIVSTGAKVAAAAA